MNGDDASHRWRETAFRPVPSEEEPAPTGARGAPVAARPVVRQDAERAASPLTLPGVSLQAAWLDLLLIALIGLIVPFGFQVTAGAMIGEVGEIPPVEILVVQKWFDMALAGGLLVYLCLRHGIAPASYGVTTGHPLRQSGWALASLAATYGWMIATVIVIGAFLLAFPPMQEDVMERQRLFAAMPVDDFWLAVLLMIPVAVHEEVLFRGLLLPYVRRVTGRWWLAVALTSGVFAALHFDQGLVGVLQILGVGTIFAVFFVLSRSLPAVCLAHLAFNLLQLQLIRLIGPLVEGA